MLNVWDDPHLDAWQALCSIPRNRRPSQRGFRLMTAACCRIHLSELMPRSLQHIRAIEDLADRIRGKKRTAEISFRTAYQEARREWERNLLANPAVANTHRVVLEALYNSTIDAARNVVRSFVSLRDRSMVKLIMKDIVGLWRWEPNSAVSLVADEKLVRTLAQAAYAERDEQSGFLEPARLGVLADAMEELGCVNEPALSHLRSPGPHVRGCRVLDLILDKE